MWKLVVTVHTIRVFQQVKKTIKLVDNTVGELWSKLEESDFIKKVNVIIVSDHGKTLNKINYIVYDFIIY